MVDINEVAENIYLIDNQLYSILGMGAVYLVNEDKKALIDVGPSASIDFVLDGIRQVGVSPEEIDYIIVTHIHLDHGGGAGLALQDMPRAKVLVHSKGAWHMANPAKLVRGMRESQGEEYFAKCGEVIPVPQERIQVVGEGDTLKLSNKQVLRFIDAPGHAPHQIAIIESRNSGVFTGEAAGSLLCDGKIMFPFANLPFDFSQFIATIKRLMSLRANAIYYAHFGASNRVQSNLELALNKALVWENVVTRAMKENNLAGVADALAAQCHHELEVARSVKPIYDFILMNIPVCAAAYIQYHQNKQAASRHN